MKDAIIRPMGSNNVIRDESQYFGMGFSASSPASPQEVSEIIRRCRELGDSITVHGSLTGINGAGVPQKGHSMGMEQLCALQYDAADDTIWAEAGASFAAIENMVRSKSKMKREFPASPTELTATVGGALSFGATGLRGYKYGSVAQYVQELEYCDSHGVFHRLRRGEEGFGMLLGSEGMCAVITGVKLSTVPRAGAVWGLMFFFALDEQAAGFADSVSALEAVSVLEYIDRASFELVEEFKSTLDTISGLATIPDGQNAAIYLEVEADTEEAIEAVAETLLELAVAHGSDPDSSWTAVGDEVLALRAFRHAVSECVNMVIARRHSVDARVKKLSAGMNFSGCKRTDALRHYREGLKDTGIAHVIFGHFGSRSLYINLLPEDAAEYIQAKELLRLWCKEVFDHGGSAFEECGVGKLYRGIYCQAAPIEEINRRIKAKQRFDPEGFFNPGNMFSDTTL